MKSTPVCRTLFTILVLFGFAVSQAADERKDDSSTVAQKKAAEKKALEVFNSFIGEWRGVGQPRRSSRRGAWIESAEWVWDFKNPQPAVRYVITNGKLLKSARITYDPKSKQFVITAEMADESKRTYRGGMQGKKLVAVSRPGPKGRTHRFTMTRLNKKRTVVLFESRPGKKGQFFRVAGIGYTRKGTSIAVSAAGGPECVVTGGEGTIKVFHKGKTYYVCCSGCKQAFDDDPEGVLADYRARLARRKKER